MSVQSKGREAHTDWKIKEKYLDKASLVECAIHTGRTHQIRVHMQNLGFPLLGDKLYGFRNNSLKGIDIERIFLHATHLELVHPRTGESLTFTESLPKDFLNLMDVLKTKYMS
jgi:23S rRNA pseudouridine1911/1915/1917 synthase